MAEFINPSAATLSPTCFIATIAQNLEQQLVQMLVDFAPEEVRRDYGNGLLNGPQIKPIGNTEVVSNQGQVDDLLDSLGF